MFDYSQPPSRAAQLTKGFLIQQFLVPVTPFLVVGPMVGADPLPVWWSLFLILLAAVCFVALAYLVVTTWPAAGDTGRWIWIWPVLGVLKDIAIVNPQRPLSWHLLTRDGLTVALVTAPVIACAVYSLTQYVLTAAPVSLVSCLNKRAVSSSGLSSITS
jgi:hypothetical protein